MSENELDRIKGDLATVRQAMGLHLSFGTEMLGFGLLLTLVAVNAAVLSRLIENDWLQVVPLAAILFLVPVGLFLRFRGTPNVSHEINLQVLVSVTTYAVVWIAACG